MLKYDTFKGYEDADKQLDLSSKPSVKTWDHIIPNTHMKSSIRAKDRFSVHFYLFGSFYQNVTFEYTDSSEKPAPLTKSLVSDDGFRHLTVFYAIFDNAVEAHVKITLTNNSDPFCLSGVIAARTTAIEKPVYSSLLFCEEHGKKIEVGDGDGIIIPFLRDIVAVPLEHDLILEYSLTIEDEYNNVMVVENYITFKAIDHGKSISHIRSNKGEFEVEVSWRSTGKPFEAEAQAK